MPLNLWSLPNEPFPGKPPKISELIKLAIWGSPYHSLTLREIFAAIEERYPSYKQAADKPWQVSLIILVARQNAPHPSPALDTPQPVAQGRHRQPSKPS